MIKNKTWLETSLWRRKTYKTVNFVNNKYVFFFFTHYHWPPARARCCCLAPAGPPGPLGCYWGPPSVPAGTQTPRVLHVDGDAPLRSSLVTHARGRGESGGSTTDKENHNDCGNPRGGSQAVSQTGRPSRRSKHPGSGPWCQARALNKVWINSNFIESKDNFKYEGIS